MTRSGDVTQHGFNGAGRLGALLTALAFALGLLLPPPSATAAAWPSRIELPDGFQPEGIAVGKGSTFYVGSIPTGAIVTGDLRTGETDLLVDNEDRSAIGLSVRGGVLFVAGGQTGQGYAYDADTGEELAAWQLVNGSAFVNDVVATRDAVYFTDSVNPQLYRVARDGRRSFEEPETIPLNGIPYDSDFNLNGIDATRNGKTLVVAHSGTGQLFTIDADTGTTAEIDLGEADVKMGDGILLHGKRLWVVQNRIDTLTLVRLAPDFSVGRIVGQFTHDEFDVPTTVARFGKRLALVNARFGTAGPQSAEYWVTQLRRPR